jgi:Tfp pilus assembly protein PilF
MHRFLQFLILGLSLALAGLSSVQSQENYPVLIQETLDYLTKYPDDVSERVRLGFYYMKTGDYRQAAQAYQLAVQQDSFSKEGWKGVLWASNALKDWDHTLSAGRQAVSLVGNDQDLVHMLAYAAFEKGDYLKARRFYLYSLQKYRANPDNTAGLGWTYLRLRDYSLARKYLSRSEGLAQAKVKDNPFDQASFVLAPESYLFLQKGNETAFSGGVTLYHLNYRFTTDVEAYLRSGKRVRTDYLIGGVVNTEPCDFLLQAHYLNGFSTRLYPAFSLNGGLSKPFYGSLHREEVANPALLGMGDLGLQWVVTPGFTLAYSHYSSIQNLQGECYINSQQGRWYEAVSLNLLHLRYSNPDSTRGRVYLQGTLGYQWTKKVDLYLLGGYGPKAYLVSKYGFLIDSNRAPDREAGLLAAYHLPGFYLEGMVKMARENNRWYSANYLSLSKGFRFLE